MNHLFAICLLLNIIKYFVLAMVFVIWYFFGSCIQFL